MKKAVTGIPYGMSVYIYSVGAHVPSRNIACNTQSNSMGKAVLFSAGQLDTDIRRTASLKCPN